MTGLFGKLWALQIRARTLQRVTPLWTAINLTLDRKKQGCMRVFVKPIGREVVIRLGTSDLTCLEKIFINSEYNSPFRVSPRVIVDAGANIGMATLFFAAKYPEAHIVAIEPEPSNFAILEKNCAGLPNVALVKAALWPVSGPLGIADFNAEKWAFSVTDERNGSSKVSSVTAITIKEILRQLGGRPIDILKLDIEGAELELFTLNADEWLDYVNFIMIELHDRFRPGCAHALYSAMVRRKFLQQMNGENIFLQILSPHGKS